MEKSAIICAKEVEGDGDLPRGAPEGIELPLGDTGEIIYVKAWFYEDFFGGNEDVSLEWVRIGDAYIPSRALAYMVGWDTIHEIEDEMRQRHLEYMQEYMANEGK